jgi:hypothetical protein
MKKYSFITKNFLTRKSSGGHQAKRRKEEKTAFLPCQGVIYTTNGMTRWVVDVMDYKKNNMSTDREKGRGTKRAKLTRVSRNPKHGKRKHYIVHKPTSGLN